MRQPNETPISAKKKKKKRLNDKTTQLALLEVKKLIRTVVRKETAKYRKAANVREALETRKREKAFRSATWKLTNEVKGEIRRWDRGLYRGIQEKFRREIELAAYRLTLAVGKKEKAHNPNGVLAAINMLAVESLFLLDKRLVRDKGKYWGLRKHLTDIERATTSGMSAFMKTAVYGTKKDGVEIPAGLLPTEPEEEEGTFRPDEDEGGKDATC